MENFQDYWDWFSEWFTNFRKSRWVRIIVLNFLAIIALITIIFSAVALASYSKTFNSISKLERTAGSLTYSVIALLIGVVELVWVVVAMQSDPNANSPKKQKKVYNPWKLWYWTPTLGFLAFFEYFFKWLTQVWKGSYVSNDNDTTTNKSFFSYRKLYFWIFTLGTGFLIDLISLGTKKIQIKKTYYWDLIFFMGVLLLAGLGLGIFAYVVRNNISYLYLG